MDMEFVRNRITEIRLQRGISEYQLSYEAGHSKNYIHNIVSGYSQPSVKELLYLIDILGITPQDFFDEKKQTAYPVLLQEIVKELDSMGKEDLTVVLNVVRRLKEKES